jgi:hypothetical protein
LCGPQSKEIDALFAANPGGLDQDKFKPFATSVCGYPSFFATALFDKLLLPGQTVVTRAKCAQWYQEQKRLLKLVISYCRRISIIQKDNAHHCFLPHKKVGIAHQAQAARGATVPFLARAKQPVRGARGLEEAPGNASRYTPRS